MSMTAVFWQAGWGTDVDDGDGDDDGGSDAVGVALAEVLGEALAADPAEAPARWSEQPATAASTKVARTGAASPRERRMASPRTGEDGSLPRVAGRAARPHP
ncbi:hypothetical protein AB0P15_27355 [Streptomyces sp. NPDC087917]|uniref:hypothetical protein n=1 Tax=unclassified Streptomyces TaxID=2593676 RepID=UPI00343460C5